MRGKNSAIRKSGGATEGMSSGSWGFRGHDLLEYFPVHRSSLLGMMSHNSCFD